MAFMGTRSGKTHLMDAWLAELCQPAGPYKFVVITKDGLEMRPGGKIIQGEVITDRREIESGSDA